MPPKKDPKEKKKKKYSHSDPRNRPRVKGSWRDRAKGDCFTVPSGKVVCEGSAGMNYKPKGSYRTGGAGRRQAFGAYDSQETFDLDDRYDREVPLRRRLEGGEDAPRPRIAGSEGTGRRDVAMIPNPRYDPIDTARREARRSNLTDAERSYLGWTGAEPAFIRDPESIRKDKRGTAVDTRRTKVRENFAKNFKIEAGDIFYNKKTGNRIIVDIIQVKDLKLAPRIVVRGAGMGKESFDKNKTGKEALTKTAFRNKYQKKEPKKK